MTSSIVYRIVTLTIDGATTFLQLLDYQNERKNTRFSLDTRVAGNSDSLFKIAVVIDYEGLVHIFYLFVC